jgi:DNA-binding Xre family transcriptional regulator
METTKDINRLKVVLAEKKRTNKWLAKQLGKDPATVSKMGVLTLLNQDYLLC